MQYIDLSNPTRIDIPKDILDIHKTFDCGQCFRWDSQPPYQWEGVINGKVYYMAQLNSDGADYILTSASMNEWNNILKLYFDIEANYDIDIPKSDYFAIQASKFGKGIRILNQDIWETLISFIISQRNNIPKIKGTIRKLCEAYGDKIEIEHKGSKRSNNFYSFPTANKLAGLESYEISELGLGYRDEYVLNAAREVDSGNLDLEKLKQLGTDELLYNLMQLKGVGPKVANCVALFGFHRLDTFPIDVWIQRIIDTYYNGSIDIKNYKDKPGLIQQYMFYYIKNGLTGGN